jgi:hypothetical protein
MAPCYRAEIVRRHNKRSYGLNRMPLSTFVVLVLTWERFGKRRHREYASRFVQVLRVISQAFFQDWYHLRDYVCSLSAGDSLQSLVTKRKIL